MFISIRSYFWRYLSKVSFHSEDRMCPNFLFHSEDEIHSSFPVYLDYALRPLSNWLLLPVFLQQKMEFSKSDNAQRIHYSSQNVDFWDSRLLVWCYLPHHHLLKIWCTMNYSIGNLDDSKTDHYRLFIVID